MDDFKTVEQPSGLLLVTEKSKLQKQREAALWKLVDFFVAARIKGTIGDILLPNESRLHGLIDDYIEKYYVPKEEL